MICPLAGETMLGLQNPYAVSLVSSVGMRFGVTLAALAALLFVLLAETAAAATTRYDAYGTTLLDGKKVFPIVLAKGPEQLGVTTPAGDDAIDELVGAGVNVFKVGPASDPWLPADFADAKSWDAEAAAHGAYTWVNLATLADAAPDKPVKDARLRQVISELEAEPGGSAIAMWKGADEPWLAGFAPAQLQYAYCVATSRGDPAWCGGLQPADSDHLFVTIQAPRGTAADLAPYSSVTDVHGVDHYPVTFTDQDPDLHGVGVWTNTLASITPSQSVWTTLQICASGSSDPSDPTKFVLPTRRQERYMIYDAILNGARNLAFYGGNLPRCWNESDTAHGWSWTFWNSVLKSLIQEIAADSPIAPALVNPASTKALTSNDATTQVISREGATSDDLWVIAARRGPGSQAVTIGGLPASVTGGSVYAEGRGVDVVNGSFTDTFDRWDVHVYRFQVPNAPPPPRPAPPPPPPPPPTPPSPPPPPPAATRATAPTALLSAGVTSRPAKPRARRWFTVSVRVVTDTGEAVTAGAVTCSARVGRKVLRAASRGWRNRAASCTWKLPASARKKILRGSVRVERNALRLTQRFAKRVG
jgi:hypothetical protein